MPPKASTRRAAPRPDESTSTSTNPASAQNAPEARTPAASATPGPAGRPSVQRLQSLKNRKPSGSIAPAGRPPSALGSEPPKPMMKYKPKAVGRRSKEERDAIERREQERHNERLREAAAIQRGRGNRGGRGTFRGRGGPMGMGANGPFGSGAGAARRGRGGASWGPGGHGGPGGGARSRFRSAISGGSRGVDYDSDEDVDDELRVSIDRIGLESDEDEDDDDESRDVKGKMPIRSREGLRPVRVTRLAHEDRVISVNMESSSSKAAEIRQKVEEAKAAEETGTAARAETAVVGEPFVKPEPVDEDTPMDEVPHDDDGFLPTQTVRVRRKLSSPRETAESEAVVELAPQTVARDPRELLRTREEIDEYDRHLEDLDHIRNLLLYEEAEKTTETATADAEEPPAGETASGDDETGEQPEDQTTNQALLGQLFLMQFPPMTPNLTLPGPSEPQPSDTTAEPAAEATNPPEVKSEGDDVQVVDDGATQVPKVITAATDWALPAGRVGKLNVHKSGRVTLDWGGISFDLDRATSVDFVQEALIVSSRPEEEEGVPPKEDEGENRVWSMGQLCGKFTVMPNWDQML
ncbi:uncharacterized protein N7482_006700 [Penicillium canariense]|uniref:DNA-directed RNA polymerase III RPC4 n=1 Tax=Penicillium canariense TaxID=189055 RepID=A0A9W9HY26_9EURO|nr:uncharacterized protein N7482_006700 [Penicillium canariense]KAJ5159696.1 hypothetical protein N7482_006700 [Penicillium canariense]